MQKNGAESVAALTRPHPSGAEWPPTKDKNMILPIRLDLKKISLLGRDYPWPRPKACRCGNLVVWGHGYVPVCFDGFADCLLIRRYRCPNCGCVIRLRPKGHFPRIQTAVSTIRHLLEVRIKTGFWPAGATTNRCRHWLCALKRKAVVILGIGWGKRLMAAFDRLMGMGCVPVSRAI
jgi:hypothetical protein